MRAKGNFYDDNKDIQFHLKKRIDTSLLFDWVSEEEKKDLDISTWNDYEEIWLEVINTFGEYAGSTVEGNSTTVSKEDLALDDDNDVTFPPAISENIKVYKELGGPALGIETKFGGAGGAGFHLMVTQELIARACPSTMLATAWYGGVADIINEFGCDELKEEFIPKIADGTYSGSMALTEPDVGSDLANVRSYGEKQDDGSWKVYGSKQFITNGQAEVCLMLAKNKKGEKGLKSLNLFLVPRTVDGQKNFLVTKLEEKPGLHGSATCALEFNGSKAYLIGKNGEGFIYMLKLMNEARIAVGFQGLGLMEAVHRLAVDFADQRKAFGKSIAKHELIAEKLFDMEVDIKAFRSLLYQSAYYASMVSLGEKLLAKGTLSVEEQRRVQKKVSYMKKNLRSWTPLIKWWCGEKSYEMARTALQIHGGYGYSTEYKAEWWVRESLILSIYEGTSQIQGLMCMKDTLKDITRRPTEFAEIALGTNWKRLAEKDPLRRKVYKMRQILNSSLVSIMLQLVKENVRSKFNTQESSGILALLKTLSRSLVKFENISVALLHAERITEMKSIVALARCLIWDAKVDESRRHLAEHFINRKMPVLIQKKAEIEADYGALKQRLNGLNANGEAATIEPEKRAGEVS